jgi:hypothetical protein
MRDEQNAHPHPEKGVHVMLRKITFALVTAIALGGAPLTPASARGFDGGWHGGGYGYRGFSYDRSYDSYNYSYESGWHFSRSHRW